VESIRALDAPTWLDADTPASETTWEAAGGLPLHELAELIGRPLQEEGITTASGWLTLRLGGFPKPGDVLTVGNFELRVEAMDGMRVERLRVLKRLEEPNAAT